MATVVRLDDVSKRFVIRKEKSLKERIVNYGRSTKFKDDFWALQGVSLEIESGSSVGLIGPNGSGKSTLLKLIGGILSPTSGTVQRRGRLAALIELGAGFHPDLTGRENVYLNCALLGVSPEQAKRDFESIVDFSGVEDFIDTQVKFYSSGMQVRLAFAVAVHVDPDVLLVDEVLAVGDEPFQRKCLDKIRAFQQEGRTIILVTHSLEQVAYLCDRAIVLEQGRVAHDGEPRHSIHRLRLDYEQMSHPTHDGVDGDVNSTVRQASVRSIEVLGDGGTWATTVNGDDGVTLRVHLHAPEPLSGWILGVGVESPGGILLYRTDTRMLGIPMPDIMGDTSLDIELGALGLRPGTFSVYASISGHDGQETHRLTAEDAITVLKADERGLGVIRLEPRFAGWAINGS